MYHVDPKNGLQAEPVFREEVDLAGDAFGVVEDAAEGVVAEELAALETGDVNVVLNVGDAVLQVEGLEMAADSQALVEGLVTGQAQGVAQGRLANQEEGGQGMAVHLVREQQSELLEGPGREEMGLVDNQQGKATTGLDQLAAADHQPCLTIWFAVW